jgi:hypothetical protein
MPEIPLFSVKSRQYRQKLQSQAVNWAIIACQGSSPTGRGNASAGDQFCRSSGQSSPGCR